MLSSNESLQIYIVRKLTTTARAAVVLRVREARVVAPVEAPASEDPIEEVRPEATAHSSEATVTAAELIPEEGTVADPGESTFQLPFRLGYPALCQCPHRPIFTILTFNTEGQFPAA
jgi:hypothetical protein